MLTVKVKGEQPPRGMHYPGGGCRISVSPVLQKKLGFFSLFFFFFHFFPLATRSERIPFSDSFVAQSVFSTQPHGQFPHTSPPTNPCFNLIMMRFADTMNICNDPGVSVNGMDFQPPVSKAHTHIGGARPRSSGPQHPRAPGEPSLGPGPPSPTPPSQLENEPPGPWCLPCPLPRQSGRPVPFTGPHYSPQGK